MNRRVIAMIVRNCAGGVVFWGDQVFLLKNDKGEWVLPKGVIREKRMPAEVALERVKTEAGVSAQIVSTAGDTNYEFYSLTRRQPVCNRIHWYVMRAENDKYRIAFELGFTDGDFFPIEQAMETITYSQDRSLVSVAYQKYKELDLA
ncbi:MAG TPA: NUDIX hydrolase [Candidatus Alectryocaccomicrobium excrementavium]|uniref:NUDIX hydrolase n=1 Tax=Candidatus Alectryocaccomicrobium excrementavium TaxID=2840668 RepID=A0A9D1K7C6_9FIRM|nr:NUDIX hydrolase [Candidatus Alectryocaccomicrobium excrementavium]